MKALELADNVDPLTDDAYANQWMLQAVAELRRLAKVNAELLESMDVALRFMRIASDWNIDEAEINGEMRSTYDLIEMVESSIIKAKEQQ
jgi:hypothetical protein